MKITGFGGVASGNVVAQIHVTENASRRTHTIDAAYVKDFVQLAKVLDV